MNINIKMIMLYTYMLNSNDDVYEYFIFIICYIFNKLKENFNDDIWIFDFYFMLYM